MKKLRMHLSTAILLSLTAGALLGANLCARDTGNMERAFKAQEEILHSHLFAYPFGWDFYAPWWKYGWPMTAYYEGCEGFLSPYWRWQAVLCNSVVALGVLAVVGVGSEFWISRRRRRQQNLAKSKIEHLSARHSQ